MHDVADALGDVVFIRVCEKDPRYLECVNVFGTVRSVHLRDEYLAARLPKETP